MLYKAKTTLKTLAKAEVIHRKTTKEGRRSRDRDASSLSPVSTLLYSQDFAIDNPLLPVEQHQ